MPRYFTVSVLLYLPRELAAYYPPGAKKMIRVISKLNQRLESPPLPALSRRHERGRGSRNA